MNLGTFAVGFPVFEIESSVTFQTIRSPTAFERMVMRLCHRCRIALTRPPNLIEVDQAIVSDLTSPVMGGLLLETLWFGFNQNFPWSRAGEAERARRQA